MGWWILIFIPHMLVWWYCPCKIMINLEDDILEFSAFNFFSSWEPAYCGFSMRSSSYLFISAFQWPLLWLSKLGFFSYALLWLLLLFTSLSCSRWTFGDYSHAWNLLFPPFVLCPNFIMICIWITRVWMYPHRFSCLLMLSHSMSFL